MGAEANRDFSTFCNCGADYVTGVEAEEGRLVPDNQSICSTHSGTSSFGNGATNDDADDTDGKDTGVDSPDHGGLSVAFGILPSLRQCTKETSMSPRRRQAALALRWVMKRAS